MSNAVRAKHGLIIGVDPGADTGICVIRIDTPSNTWELHSRQTVRTAGGVNLLILNQELRKKLVNHEEPVFGVAMEVLMAYVRNAQEKAEAQGVIRLVAAQHMIGLHEYAPTTVRSRVVGSGKAKESDINHVTRTLAGLERTKKGEKFDKHQQDALAVALCHAIEAELLQSIEPAGTILQYVKRPKQPRTALKELGE